MKTHTSEFKNQIKTMGREIDSKITYTLNGVNVELGGEQLNSITPTYQGALLKSVMKELDIDSNVYIPEKTILNYQFGLKVNGKYEYINYGNYVVYSIEKQEDTNSYKITCYDKLLYSMLDYVKLPITYPISIRDYINAISTALGLTFANKNDTFANYDKQIQADLYDGLGYTFRDVLDELAQVTASTICLNNNDELEIRYITETNDTIDEEFLKDVNVNFGEKFGAVNTIVLSRSGDSDSVYYPSVLPSNPYEIKISDNQIMNGNDRADFLPDIYNKLNGLEFYTNDFVSTGICYYDLCDRYSVKVGDNTYSCVMFNDEVLVTQGLEENVYTELPEQTETDYKHASKDDRMINQVYIIAKKNEAEILALVSTTETIQKEINPTKDESGSEIIIEDASNNPLTYLEIEGKSTQETSTQSANLFDEDYYRNATYTNNVYRYTLSKIKGGRRLYVKAKLKEGKSAVSGIYVCLSTNPNPNTSGSQYQWFINNGNTPNASFNPATFTDYLYFSFYPTTTTLSQIFDNYNLWVSTDNINYEPFVPDMPSPEYPSEIESVGYENLLENNISTTTINGITFTKNADGTITANGTAAADVVLDVGRNLNNEFKEGTYFASGCPLNGSSSTYQITLFKTLNETATELGRDFGSGLTISINETCYLWERIVIYSGQTVSNLIFKPMITKGSQSHSYIPYGKYGIELKVTNGTDTNTSLFQLDQPLRSLPNGVKDELVIENGRAKIIKNVAKMIVANGNFYVGTTWNGYFAQPEGKINEANNRLLCDRAIANRTYTDGTMYDNEANVMFVGNNTDTIETLKAKYDGATLYYQLATPTEIDLGEVETLSTFKGVNNITTTDSLLPIINLTYVRDTIIADYVENHVAELKLTEKEIKTSVESVSSSVDGLNSTVNRVEEITNDNSQVLNIISTNIDRTSGEVREVTTTTGFTFNAEGMAIADGSGFKAQHTAQGTFYKDGDSITGQYTKDGSKQKDLELFGTYSYGKNDINDIPMFVAQLYTDENGEECFGHFVNI